MFNKRIIYLFLVVFLLAITGVAGGKGQLSQQKNIVNIANVNVDDFFRNTEGTFILKDVESGKMFIYNDKRAEVRQAPQSTFKIMNSLIGLQVKAVQDEYDIKHWDGIQRGLSVWNQDHTLGSAMRYSVVWYYQAMARDIGDTQMQNWLDQCSYGNRDISGGIDQFWLSSSLKISPIEQVEFLEKLYQEKLPFDKSVQKTVKRMLIQQEGDNYILYGKTGSTGMQNNHSVGWYIGFIIVQGHPYIFATNLETQGDFAGLKAKEQTLAILKTYQLITQ